MKKLCVLVLGLAAGFGSFAETNKQIIGYILFEKDKYEFVNSDFTSRQLDEWAGWLKLMKVKQIHITGYAIKTPNPDPDENVLAKDRAIKVLSELQRRVPDISSDVFAPPAVQIVEWNPESDDQEQSLNRRATISVETAAEIIPPPPGPSPAEELCRQGDVYYRAGELDQALEMYNKAVSLDSNYAPAYLRKASVFYWQRDWENAKAKYAEAQERDEKYAGFSGAFNSLQTQSYDAGLTDINQVIATAPLDGWLEIYDAYRLRGLMLEGMAQYPEAMNAYTVCTDLAPAFYGTYYSMAYVSLHTENLDQAVEYGTKAVGLNPHDPESRGVLAQAYYALADKKWRTVQKSREADNAGAREVKELLNRVIDLDPEFIPARADKIAVCIYLEEYDQALESIRALENLDPNNSHVKNGRNRIAEVKGFVPIKGGTFTMGSPKNEPQMKDDEIPHQVTVRSFRINKYEVSQEEYEKVMETNPSMYKASKNLKLPVEQVSWFDAVEYCNRRSQKEGLSPAYGISGTGDNRTVTWNQNANGYRLPTEAEWEFACRANTKTPFNTGDTITTEQANYNGKLAGQYRGKTTAVDETFTFNGFRLYNMHGNVAEWCWDWYGAYSEAPQTNPKGPDSGTKRVIRGGSFGSPGHEIRSASRDRDDPLSCKDVTIGFRLALPDTF